MENLPVEAFKQRLQDPLFIQWLTLNYRPSHWLGAERLSEQFPQMHHTLLQRADMQDWIKDKMQLEYLDWAFFRTPLTRLLFVPTGSLRHIMTALGALCYQLQLNVMIEKRFRQQLFNCLPASTLQYIEQTGPLLLAQQPPLMIAIREQIDLWDVKKQQLVDLNAIGELILHKALLHNVSNSGEGELLQQLPIWQRYYGLKFPQSTVSRQGVTADKITTLANPQVITLIIKLTRHLEPRCLTLLK